MLSGYTSDNYRMSQTLIDDLFIVPTLPPEWCRNDNYIGSTEVDGDKLIKAFVAVSTFMDLLRSSDCGINLNKTYNELKPLILSD